MGIALVRYTYTVTGQEPQFLCTFSVRALALIDLSGRSESPVKSNESIGLFSTYAQPQTLLPSPDNQITPSDYPVFRGDNLRPL